ncbi:MAG: dethiobiotin synthase [Verrucomicrobiota bacterium]
MNPTTLFITGTDTDAGKTVVGCLLARFLSNRHPPLGVCKPVCSGNRNDARHLRTAAGATQSLDEINPWHFTAPIAPVLAARRERKFVRRRDVLAHLRSLQRRFPILIVEGAGGLLSPLGTDFDSRDLILALRARPILVCPDRLGAVNQVRLALAALPPAVARTTPVVLSACHPPDPAAPSNALLLREILGPNRVHRLPRLRHPHDPTRPALRHFIQTLATSTLKLLNS